MFDNCGKRKTTIKQEFEWIGLSNSALKKKSLTELEEETVFACMMNWIIHKMQQEESTKLRFRAANKKNATKHESCRYKKQTEK